MEDDDFERPQISKRKVLALFFVFLAIAWGASTLAGTITINANDRVEFGQGTYNLKACDSFVRLDPRSGTGANLDKVQYLDLSGFDKKKCKNKYFAIRFQNNGTNLALFSNGSKRIVLHVDNSNEPNVSLVYTYGETPGSDIPATGDGLQKITYSSGVYTVEFLNPIVTVSSVTRTTFESAGAFNSLSSD